MKSQNPSSSSAANVASGQVRRSAEDKPPQRKDRFLRRTLTSLEHLGYLISALPVALVSFVLLVSGISLSACLAVVWVGFPLALITLAVARQFAGFELSRLRFVGVYIAVQEPAGTTTHLINSSWRRSIAVMRDRRAWREVLHGLVALPLAVATFSIAVTWTAGTVGGLTSWLWSSWLPPTSLMLGELIGLPRGWTWPELVIGVVFAETIMPVLRTCVRLHSGLARLLLSDDHDRATQSDEFSQL